MSVRRIVANFAAADPERSRAFYEDVLGLEAVMDFGWIITFAGGVNAQPQISVAAEGGAGTEVPDVSVEVDDVDAVLAKARAAGFDIVYGPVDEEWGVRRFYVREPSGKIVNILSHAVAAKTG